MAKYFINGAVTLGIVGENNENMTYTGDDATGLGSLFRDGATHTYNLITNKGSLTLNDVGYEWEDLERLEDFYTHRTRIREVGGGTCEFTPVYDDADALASIEHLLYAGSKFPEGLNNTGATTPSWNSAEDTAITKSTDIRGYAIMVAQEIVGASKYVVWVFHNCRIMVSGPDMGPKRRTTMSITWEDARYMDGQTDATTLVDYYPAISSAVPTAHYDA